jgi:glycosyltransferase involved in cell wall biosynthesis
MITVTILTKDSDRKIARALESVSWAKEVVILDTGSTDRTLQIAASFPNVKIYSALFSGFGQLHNQMAGLASHDWILSLDSDERISPELAQELQQLALDPRTIYSIPRRNYFNGRWIRGCGWYPDRAFRLYHRQYCQFSLHAVHERLVTKGMRRCDLHSPIDHFSYDCLADFLRKMQLYTDLFAEQHRQGRKSSCLRAFFAQSMAFIRSYILKLGFRDGAEGWIISCYNAQTAYYKYLKLREVNRKELVENAPVARGKGKLPNC